MFTDLDKYVHLLCELDITANQFLLCYLHYTDDREDGELIRKGSSMANLYRYAENVSQTWTDKESAWTKDEVKDLVDKGYLEDPHYDSDTTYPDYLKVTDKFKEKIFIQPTKYHELTEAYPTTVPNFHSHNGPDIKLQMGDDSKLKPLYLKKVVSKVKHKKIIELVKWAAENGEINCSLEKFIRGNGWETLRDMRKEKGGDNMTVQ